MEITIAGLPVRLYYDANGYIVTALFQTVAYNGSPLIITLTPPLGPVDRFSLPETVDRVLRLFLLQALIAALLGGAIIG